MSPLKIKLLILAVILAAAAALSPAGANLRTPSPELTSSQGVASVIENLRTLARAMLNHQHRGDDGSSQLENPYISGDVILQSDNGACWSCGPSNAGAWSCASTTCPS